MPRVRKSIKPDLELLYKNFKESKLPEPSTLEYIVRTFITDSFTLYANNLLMEEKVIISFKDGIVSRPYSGNLNNYSLQTSRYENKLSFIYNFSHKDFPRGYIQFIKDNWTTVRDYEKAQEYIDELFGEGYKVKADKKLLLFPEENPFHKFILDNKIFVFNYLKTYLKENNIEFIEEEEFTLSVDFKQFID